MTYLGVLGADMRRGSLWHGGGSDAGQLVLVVFMAVVMVAMAAMAAAAATLSASL